MSKHPNHHGASSPLPTCKDCMHAIRDNRKQQEVVCVPHLKTMPSNNSTLCDLYAVKNKAGAMSAT